MNKKALSILVMGSLLAALVALPAGEAAAKKKKKKPVVPACAAYVPGDQGAGQPIAVVTDAATEASPVVVEVEAAPGMGSDLGIGVYDERTSVFHNVQVDSALPTAGLWVRIEFTEYHDYDLSLLTPAGDTAASSGESQPVAGVGGGTAGGHEGGSNYEMVTGVNTPDCGGYTTEVISYLTTGGPVTISYWLGEGKVDPEA